MNTTHLTSREITKFYDKGFDWALTIGPRILLATLLLFVGIRLIRQLRKKISERIQRKRVASALHPFIESLAYTVLHVALLLLILQVLGVRLTIFAAVIAAFGAAAGLALSGTLQNFASGVLILMLRPFNVGDNISAQGIEGTVTSIQIFYTIIKTFDNRTVIMPNSKLSNEVITNITQQGVRRLDLELKFKNEIDFSIVKEKLAETLKKSKDALNEPPPRAGIIAVDQDSYTVRCNIWVKAHGFEDSRMAINEAVLNMLKAELTLKKAA